MKKRLTALCIIALIALLCATLVACDTGSGNTDDGNQGQNTYETAKYTVTFNPNSDGYTFSGNVLKDVVAGSKIKAPVNENGEKIIPVKKGYTFQFWSADGSKEFDFNTQTINKNTTLTALYTPNTFTHNYVLDATYTYNEDGTITIAEDTYKSTTGYEMALGANVKLQSTYAATSDLACPTATKGEDSDDFCFWFYIDNDGKPVMFTNFSKSAENATVTSKSKYTLTYNSSDVLTLYPMFRSQLPKVQVKYYDIDGESVLNETTLLVTDTIEKSDAYHVDDKSNYNGKSYKFDKWYYEITDEDGVVEQIEMKFEDNNVDGTTLQTALDLSANDYFTEGTLKLYSKWTRQIEISSNTQFIDLYNAMHADMTDESNKAEAEEIRKADIRIVGEINLNANVFEPIFDKDHVFVGTIDGGLYGSDDNLIGDSASLIGGTFTGTDHVSVFGYVNGKISNLVIDNPSFSVLPIDSESKKYADEVYIGGVATQNAGVINNVIVKRTANVDGTDEKLLNRVVVGGIVAINKGTATAGVDDGYISNCSVEMEIGVKNVKSFVYGGIVGENKTSTALKNNNVTVTIKNILATGEGTSVKFGGLVGVNAGEIEGATVSVTADSEYFRAEYAFSFGGAVAENNGGVKRVATTLNMGNRIIVVGGAQAEIVNIGGIIGKNNGYIQNSYVKLDNMHVVPIRSNASVAIGGIVGNNHSDITNTSTSDKSKGAIYYCYSVVSGSEGINVMIEEGVNNAKLYVGGIAGRNSQKAIRSCFTNANIIVSEKNRGIDHNNIYMGYGFGSMENQSGVNNDIKCWYYSANLLSLNGQAYEVDGDGNPSFAITSTMGLKATEDGEAFVKKQWYTDKYVDFDTDVWNIVDGEYPTLK